MEKKRNKAQSFLEYAVIIFVVAAALVAMRMYFVRAVQEKYRQTADVFGEGEQYESGVTNAFNLDDTGTTIPPSQESICLNVTSEVTMLGKQINGYTATGGTHVKGLLERAQEYETNAAQLRQQAKNLEEGILITDNRGRGRRRRRGTTTKVEIPEAAETIKTLLAQAVELENQATALRQEAQDKQALIDSLKKDYPDCF